MFKVRRASRVEGLGATPASTGKAINSQQPQIECKGCEDPEILAEAALLLDRPVRREEYERIGRRAKTHTQIAAEPRPAYDDYQSCLKILDGGISATKFNFSNTKYRDVIIQLSPCRKKLLYSDEKSSFRI